MNIFILSTSLQVVPHCNSDEGWSCQCRCGEYGVIVQDCIQIGTEGNCTYNGAVYHHGWVRIGLFQP